VARLDGRRTAFRPARRSGLHSGYVDVAFSWSIRPNSGWPFFIQCAILWTEEGEGIPVTMQSLPQLAPDERAAVVEYLARIRDLFPERILSVTLFGSKARGDADPESDVDLLLVVDAKSRQFRSQLWQIASDISLEHNLVISVRVFAQDRWAETQRLRLPLYRAVAAEGIPLIEEPG
jgi:predicted nucleotidyltransferase